MNRSLNAKHLVSFETGIVSEFLIRSSIKENIFYIKKMSLLKFVLILRATKAHCKWRAGENPVHISGSHLHIPRKKLFCPKRNYNVLSLSSCIHISVRNLYISRIGLPILLQGNMWTDPVNI